MLFWWVGVWRKEERGLCLYRRGSGDTILNGRRGEWGRGGVWFGRRKEPGKFLSLRGRGNGPLQRVTIINKNAAI